MFILMYFCQKSSCSDTLPALLTLGFTAITDHMRVVEILPACGPQSGTATVRIPIRFQSRAMQSSGMAGSHWADSLALSKWTAGAELFWAKSQNHSALPSHHENTEGGKFRHGKGEVKTERTLVLNSPPKQQFN